jgi:hypothetical protein
MLRTGVYKFSKILGQPPQNSRRQEGGIMQLAYEDRQILGATVKNVVARTTWRQEFVHPWLKTREPANIKCYSTKFVYPRDLATGTCAPLA